MSGHTNGLLHRPPHSRRSREPSDYNVASISGRSVCSTGGYSDNNPETYDENKANARRICAAWNACEGIPTEALEAGVVKDMLEALRIAQAEIVALERDFKTLLRGDFVEWRTHEETGDPLLVVEAAIARATGEKP